MSKLLTSPILYKNIDHWGTSSFATKSCFGPFSLQRRWWFCTSEFRDHFDVPETAMKVWLEFYTSPAANRYKAESREGLVYLDGKLVEVMFHVVAMIVRRTKRTTCYVECHYEVSA